MMWHLIHIADWLLWIFVAFSVAYVAFFAFASLLRRRERGTCADVPHDTATAVEDSPLSFLVIYPAYNEDAVIRNSIEKFLQQDFPSERYRLVVVSDHMQPDTNGWLAAQPLTLLQPRFERSSKAQALQYAIANAQPPNLRSRLDGADNPSQLRVVILDADNVVNPDFLSRLDKVCRQGYRAIQCHRTAKNSDNDIAVLDGVSEEINNTLFRRAHNNIGMSSALIGSGMCFEYDWFRANVGNLSSAVEDRELEALLMREGIFVKYEEDILVMDEKVSSRDNFQRQRLRWMTGQVQALLRMIPYLPKAILKGNVNYVDKTLQQALLPRSILLAVVPVMALLTTLLDVLTRHSLTLVSAKWWLLLLLFALSLFLAIPSRLRSRAVFSKVGRLPALVGRMMGNLFRIDKNNTDFIHTTHDK
jgi:cellulose synthase/poly-beta-1,6-N-acetylglucosamine synthase-like glycosyltransferase